MSVWVAIFLVVWMAFIFTCWGIMAKIMWDFHKMTKGNPK